MFGTSQPESQQLSPVVQEGAADAVSSLPWSIQAVLLPLADVLHWPRALSDPSPASDEDAAVLRLLLYTAGGAQQAQHATHSLAQSNEARQRSARAAQALNGPDVQSQPAEAGQQSDPQAINMPAPENQPGGMGDLRGSGGLLSSTAEQLVLRVLAQVRSEHWQHMGGVAGAAWQQMLSRQPRAHCLRCVLGCLAAAGCQSRCGCCGAYRVHGKGLVPVELRSHPMRVKIYDRCAWACSASWLPALRLWHGVLQQTGSC